MSMHSSMPVIRKALGEDWHRLDSVVRRHYDLSPGEEAAMTMQGKMYEIDHSFVAKLFLIPGRLFGALIPYKGRDIEVSVPRHRFCNIQSCPNASGQGDVLVRNVQLPGASGACIFISHGINRRQ